jgi:hypothetical protein
MITPQMLGSDKNMCLGPLRYPQTIVVGPSKLNEATPLTGTGGNQKWYKKGKN